MFTVKLPDSNFLGNFLSENIRFRYADSFMHHSTKSTYIQLCNHEMSYGSRYIRAFPFACTSDYHRRRKTFEFTIIFSIDNICILL